MTAPYSSEEQAKRDTLCRPLTLAQVMERTGRSQRTIQRWTTRGLLTKYELDHPRETVYIEREVLEVDRDQHSASRQGRPRPSKNAGVDAGG